MSPRCCNCYFYLGRFKRETTDTRREGPPAESNCSRSGRTPAGQDEQSLHDCFAAEQARLYKQVLRCWPERSCSADTSFFIMPFSSMSVYIIILGQPHQISRKKRTYLSPPPQKKKTKPVFSW